MSINTLINLPNELDTISIDTLVNLAKDTHKKVGTTLAEFRKVVLPYYRNKIRDRMRASYNRYPGTTFFSTILTLGALAQLGCDIITRNFDLAHYKLLVAIPLAYISDKAIGAPDFIAYRVHKLDRNDSRA